MLKKVILIVLIVLATILFTSCLKDKPENYEQETEVVDSVKTDSTLKSSLVDSCHLDTTKFGK